MVNLEAVIKSVREDLDRTAQRMKETVEDAITQARAEREVMAQAAVGLEKAAGVIVKDIRVLAAMQPNGLDPVKIASILRAGAGYFGRGAEGFGGSDAVDLGEQTLPPGKYRAVVLFFKREV